MEGAATRDAACGLGVLRYPCAGSSRRGRWPPPPRASSHSGSWTAAPSAQVSGTVALDHVDQHAKARRDRPGPWRRRCGGPVSPRGTSSCRCPAPAPSPPAGVVDQRGTATDDSVHDRPPAHPELLGHDSDGQGELADLTGGLGAGDASAAPGRARVANPRSSSSPSQSQIVRSASAASARSAGPDARSRAGHGCRRGGAPWPAPARHIEDIRRRRSSSRP